MADFRKSIIALAAGALFTGFASMASAAPLGCTATAVPTTVRSEGLTELLGDIVLNCSGSTTAAVSVNVSVYLANTSITSRILDGGGSEAMLLLGAVDGNELTAVGGEDTVPCPWPQTTPCPTGANVYQGVVSGNRVDFFNVTIAPTGTAGMTRILRITNLRGNASAVGVGAGTIGSIPAFVSITGSTSIPVPTPSVTLAVVQPGLEFSVVKAGKTSADLGSLSGLTFSQCTKKSAGAPDAVLRFSELFGTAFKPLKAGDQDVPGQSYNTESGLIYSGFESTAGIPAGQANFGTRLRATFNNIPVGVNLYVSTSNILNDAAATDASPIYAALVSGDTAAEGSLVDSTDSLSAFTSTNDKLDAAKLTLTGGVATATWEVINEASLISDNIDFDVWITATPDLTNNLPTPNSQGTVAGSFAPTYTSAAAALASSSLPIPRFVDTGSGQNLVKFVICQTNLLFPFVTNKVGFDTGIAIANTSTDPFGTATQTGTCTLNFYGDDAPSAVTTDALASGKVYTTLAQTVAPNFQGYVIAQCQFQMAHGFAFVSDVGARNIAMGYLALIIPTDTATGKRPDAGTGENLNN